MPARRPADKNYFEGLPSPSAHSDRRVAFVWFSKSKPPAAGAGAAGGLIAAFLIAVLQELLMVSSFNLPSFKKFDIDRRIKRAYMVIVPVFFGTDRHRSADDAVLDFHDLRAVGHGAMDPPANPPHRRQARKARPARGKRPGWIAEQPLEYLQTFWGDRRCGGAGGAR